MTDVHTFTPRRARVRKESLVVAALTAAAMLAFLYLSGERNPLLLAGLPALAAALNTVPFLFRFHDQWLDEIQLSREGVTLVRDGAPHTHPWSQVASVRHLHRAGHRWILESRNGHPPVIIRADGLGADEVARLRELIPALHAAAQPDGAGGGG